MRNAILIIAAFFAISCTVEKSEKLVADPEYSSSAIIYQDIIEPIIHTGELIVFFDEYQQIRYDRDKALELYSSTFGKLPEESVLAFETVSTVTLGKVVMQQIGYLAYTDQTTPVKLKVQYDGKEGFSCSGEGGKVSVGSMTMNVSGNDIISEIDISYSTDNGTVIIAKTTEPLVKQKADGKTYCTPRKGTLAIHIMGESVDDEFSLTFDGPNMRIYGGCAGGEFKAFYTYNTLFKQYEQK